MKRIFAILSVFLPWIIRRPLLSLVLGYELHPTSRIGFSLVMPGKLVMMARSSIGHFNVCKGLDRLELSEDARIGQLNWVTGFPAPSQPGQHFQHQLDRKSELIIGEGAGITSRHFIDCTNSVTLGKFCTVGGFRCQIMTHSVEIVEGRQSSAPIEIGEYSLVSTACVMLGGSRLPDYCVLGACSLANKPLTDTHTVYAGVPARPIKKLPEDSGYFVRDKAYIL